MRSDSGTFTARDLAPALFCGLSLFMNKLAIITERFLFMPPNQRDSSKASDSQCFYPFRWRRRSERTVSCSRLNLHKGSSAEPERFTVGRPPDVVEQHRADKSKALSLSLDRSDWDTGDSQEPLKFASRERGNWLAEARKSSVNVTSTFFVVSFFG